MLWIFTSTWRSNNVLNIMCQVCVISMHVGFNISRVHLIKSLQFKSMLLRTPEVNVTLRPACIRTGHGSNQQTSSSKQDIVSHLRLLKVKLRSLPLRKQLVWEPWRKRRTAVLQTQLAQSPDLTALRISKVRRFVCAVVRGQAQWTGIHQQGAKCLLK